MNVVQANPGCQKKARSDIPLQVMSIVDEFQNVKICNLVVKLLDVQKTIWTKTNGMDRFEVDIPEVCIW